MRHLHLKLILGITLLLAVVTVLIHQLPYADNQRLREFLTPPDCQMPCLMGISPGVMTWQDAEAILDSHPWVSSSETFPAYGLDDAIVWQWSGQQPEWVKGDGGLIYVRNSTVDRITISTTLSLADFQLLLGAPELDGIDECGGRYLAWFGQGTLLIEKPLYYPVQPVEFWSGQVVISLGRDYHFYAYTTIDTEFEVYVPTLRQPPRWCFG